MFRHTHLPKRGHCVPAYLCAGLYIVNDRGDQFSLVVRIGARMPSMYYQSMEYSSSLSHAERSVLRPERERAID
jgi:hypothetical protein